MTPQALANRIASRSMRLANPAAVSITRL